MDKEIITKHKRCDELPLSQRPFEKCEVSGPELLSDAELLSVIFRSGSNKKRITEISRSIIDLCEQYGGLAFLDRIPREELLALHGVGRIRAVQLKCLGELSKRIAEKKRSNQLTRINSPEDIYRYFLPALKNLEAEELWVLMLDGKNNIIRQLEIAKGSSNSCAVPVREILKNALKYGAASIALIHNHPSGDPEPSDEDIWVTKKFDEASRYVDLNFIDHVIIGDNCYYSMLGNGYLKK